MKSTAEVKCINKVINKKGKAVPKSTHLKCPLRDEVYQRVETVPLDQAGWREYELQEHVGGLGLEQLPLPALQPVNPHSPMTGKWRMLS